MSDQALSLRNYAAPMPWHHRISFAASPEHSFIPGLVHATYLKLLHQQLIVMCLDWRHESRISKPWIVTCSHSVSSAFGASCVLLSCGHELTFVEHLIVYQQRSPTLSHELLTMRWDNSHSNCSQGGREGPYHCSDL